MPLKTYSSFSNLTLGDYNLHSILQLCSKEFLSVLSVNNEKGTEARYSSLHDMNIDMHVLLESMHVRYYWSNISVFPYLVHDLICFAFFIIRNFIELFPAISYQFYF